MAIEVQVARNNLRLHKQMKKKGGQSTKTFEINDIATVFIPQSYNYEQRMCVLQYGSLIATTVDILFRQSMPYFLDGLKPESLMRYTTDNAMHRYSIVE